MAGKTVDLTYKSKEVTCPDCQGDGGAIFDAKMDNLWLKCKSCMGLGLVTIFYFETLDSAPQFLIR